MEKIIDNKVTLNPVEFCDFLATRDLINSYRNFYNIDETDEEIEDKITVEDENGEFHFTEEAQDNYNSFYEEYWTIIEKLAL